jgi:hypothetical protein
MHYHFFLNLNSREFAGEVVKKEIVNYSSNFPFKCFYNEDENEIYCFYRQGESFIVKEGKAEEYQMDKVGDTVLGTMYLIYNKALVAGTSDCTSLFKLVWDEILERRVWKLYQTINVAGSAYYTKGNIRIQICQQEKIYFYLVDRDTLKADLENVMYNYMQCSYMMIGPKVRYCVTFKNSSKGYNIFRAKYIHNFKVNVHNQNLENAFVVTHTTGIKIYDSANFKQIGALDITLLESKEREPNEVLTIQKCQNEEYLAVLSGKNLIMQEQKLN